MGFSDWSTRLTDYFFGPHQDQRRVRLMVNREVLDGEFSYLGGTEQFLEDMRNGPDWNNINSSFTTIRDRALYLWDIWKEPHLRGDQYPDVGSHGQDGPPFLPYLCLLCITWTEAGDDDSVRAGHNFHGRFETIYPDQNLRQHIAKLLPLWQGLQKWTERNDAKFGRFVVEQLGGQIHVGIPKSQVILTTHKIERLSELFHLSMLPLGGAASKEEIRIAWQ